MDTKCAVGSIYEMRIAVMKIDNVPLGTVLQAKVVDFRSSVDL